MQTMDLIRGTRTTQLDLSALPFLSHFGPSEGTLTIVTDASDRVVDLHVSLFSSRRVILRELDRIASEADWAVPVDDIRQTTTTRFVVDLELDPAGKARLAETEIRMDGASVERIGTLLRPLLKDTHYRVVNLREVHPLP